MEDQASCARVHLERIPLTVDAVEWEVKAVDSEKSIFSGRLMPAYLPGNILSAATYMMLSSVAI